MCDKITTMWKDESMRDGVDFTNLFCLREAAIEKEGHI